LIRSEIWYELSSAIYGAKYISLYLSQVKKRLSLIEYLSIVFIIGGAIGWYKIGQYSEIWMLIIIAAKLVHYFRGKILMTTERIIELKGFESHLIYKKIELEDLWVKLNTNKVTDEQSLAKIKKLKKMELAEKLDIQQIPNNKELNIIASKYRNDYLIKFI